MTESLEDHLRRATRNFTAPLPEDAVLALGRDLARELARAHAETPPRHPALELSRIEMVDGRPRLVGDDGGDVAGDLFELGALLNGLATATTPEPAWRLDGPPPVAASTVARRHVFAALGSPLAERRLPTAQAAAEALAAALDAASDAPAPWPLFRGDPERRGARMTPPVTGFEPLWDTPIGAVVASPVLTASLVLCATADGRVVFLERAGGRVIHELPLGAAVESSPALAGTTLFVGTDDGSLVAVDVVKGTVAFRAKLGQLVRSSPLPRGERVLVGLVEPRGAGAVVAVDAGSGKLAWRRATSAVFSSPALAGSAVLVGSDDGNVHALDAATGAVQWSSKLSGKVRATPAVAADRAVVGDFAGRVAAVNAADGTLAWSAEIGHPVYSSACLAAGLALVGCNEGHLHALDLATGALRFELPLRGPVVGSAAASGERFLVGSTAGDLHLIDAAGHEIAQTRVSPAGIQSSPALDGAFAAIGSGGGVHALRLVP